MQSVAVKIYKLHSIAEPMYPRFIEQRVRNAMKARRIVLISGPRQSGKTTLARHIADDELPFISLDDPSVLQSAIDDPYRMVRDHERAVIDEVHRAPGLILPIKLTVDADTRPGRYLFTTSADLLALPELAEKLTGRVNIIRLLPLAQAELRNSRPTFLDRVFAGQRPIAKDAVDGNELVDIVLAGGYPEAVGDSASERQQWHLDYVDFLIHGDISHIAQVEQLDKLRSMPEVLAEYSGQLLNYSNLSSILELNRLTVKKYTGIFESLFIVRMLKPWHSKKLKRLIKTPKLHFLDSGLLAAIRGISRERLDIRRAEFGPLLESFVFSELLKLSSWTSERYSYSHFRDKQGNEVDIVMEDRQGQVVGIEVKAGATISAKDFSGLRHLAAACGERFVTGLVLYDHDQTLPFGERMWAAPVSTLWS